MFWILIYYDFIKKQPLLIYYFLRFNFKCVCARAHMSTGTYGGQRCGIPLRLTTQHEHKEPNSATLQEQEVLLIAEHISSPLNHLFCAKYKF